MATFFVCEPFISYISEFGKHKNAAKLYNLFPKVLKRVIKLQMKNNLLTAAEISA
jgi:hypothetical protein